MIAGASLLALGVAGSAVAADGAALYQSKACFSCHGADAKTPIMPAYPKLAGQNADYAYNQMKDIKSGARANGQTAAMKGIIAGVSDEEMRAIAEWLSQK
ncbi:MAG: c-type cytochrome [Gammaproteobacteria bacterium]|nr:c-type cytochrome [Gammaproteobacteria bacterium]